MASKHGPIARPLLIFLALLAGLAEIVWTPSPALRAAPQADSQALLRQADEVLRQMSEITGLPIRASLRKEIISRPEVEKYLTENLHAEMPPRELHIQEATLQAFGLVPRDFHLEKFLVAFYTEQAAGFYDPRRKTMFIADWASPEMQSQVLAHELTHALQDQNFDLDKFLHAVRANDDATNAREAVAEGHATAAMMQSSLAPADLASLPSLEPFLAQLVSQKYEEFPAFSAAPFSLRLQAVFPYVEGMGLMQRGLQQGGWQTLNSMFAHPPRTTKEIFEPEVYFGKLPLGSVSLERPGPLEKVPGLQLLTENVMGELGYYALLGQLISEDEAKAVGKGWMGDRYILYENAAGNDYTLLARTRWASPETALAFFRDYQIILTHKYPQFAADNCSTPDLFIGSAANGEVILLRKGDECLWAEGVPPAQVDAMLNWLRAL